RLGVAGVAAAEAFARLEDRGTAGAVDGAVDAAAAEQRRVGGVDDRVHTCRGDVALRELDALGAGHEATVIDGAGGGTRTDASGITTPVASGYTTATTSRGRFLIVICRFAPARRGVAPGRGGGRGAG